MGRYAPDVSAFYLRGSPPGRDRADSGKIFIVERSDIRGRQGNYRLRLPRSAHEFHFESVRSVPVYDRAEVAAPKVMFRQVPLEYDGLELVKSHIAAPG